MTLPVHNLDQWKPKREPCCGWRLTCLRWFFSALRLVLRRHYCLAIRICDYLTIPKGEGASRILGHWACYKVSVVSVHCGSFQSSDCKLFIRECFFLRFPTHCQNVPEVFQNVFVFIKLEVWLKEIQMFLVIVNWVTRGFDISDIFYFCEPCWVAQGWKDFEKSPSFCLFITSWTNRKSLAWQLCDLKPCMQLASFVWQCYQCSSWGQLVASLEDEIQSL